MVRLVIAAALSATLVACKAPPAEPQADPARPDASSLAARVASAAASATPPASTSTPEVAGADGPTLYKSLCAICHGADATGYAADNAPSLVNRTFLESATDEQITRSIATGRPGTSMAGYAKDRGGPLGPAELGRIVGWLRSHGPAPQALPERHAGDAARGAPLYAKNCERCHGTAHARGNAVFLANPRFLDVFPDAFIGYAITQGRPGTAMEAWAKKLTEAQVDDVVAHVRSLAATPVSTTLPAPTGKEPIVLNPAGKPPSFKPRSTACPPAPITDAGCKPDNRFVSVQQVKEALEAKRRLVIIDARPASDWMSAHIAGAVSIPYHDLKRLDEVPNDGTWVIAYCACPHHLSGDVVDALRKRGVEHAAILDEGILEWQRRGYPVVTAPGVAAPPPIMTAAPVGR